ncbi:hypothetical protein INR49_012347 [Caranx melampygus]|nr:hypothetical protein INR49_012347 [Caranx melampygus]
MSVWEQDDTEDSPTEHKLIPSPTPNPVGILDKLTWTPVLISPRLEREVGMLSLKPKLLASSWGTTAPVACGRSCRVLTDPWLSTANTTDLRAPLSVDERRTAFTFTLCDFTRCMFRAGVLGRILPHPSTVHRMFVLTSLVSSVMVSVHWKNKLQHYNDSSGGRGMGRHNIVALVQ